jgi:hypothetical protein
VEGPSSSLGEIRRKPRKGGAAHGVLSMLRSTPPPLAAPVSHAGDISARSPSQRPSALPDEHVRRNVLGGVLVNSKAADLRPVGAGTYVQPVTMPVVAVSALDVAFASAVAAALAAILSPLSAWLIARGGRQHELALAREARNYEARREIYVEALTDATKQVSSMGTAMAAYPRDDDLVIARLDARRSSRDQIEARRGSLAALGSVPVLAAIDAWISAEDEFWRWLAMHPPGEPLPAFASAKAYDRFNRAVAARANLEEAVRADLQGQKPARRTLVRALRERYFASRRASTAPD